jgi:hypothetical protein
VQTNREHEGPQVSDLVVEQTDPLFQAGHAGSIPVTRSKRLTSANAESHHVTLKSGTSQSATDLLIAERERGIPKGH